MGLRQEVTAEARSQSSSSTARARNTAIPAPGVRPAPDLVLRRVLASQWTKLRRGVVHSRTNAAPVSEHAPVVVLVHGMVISSSYMEPTAAQLAPLCRVHAVDLPGYGRSYKPRPILLLPQLADALAAWMDAVRLARAHFLGNSFGCQVIAEFAVRHPQRVDRLVLQGPTVDPKARTLGRQLFRLWLNGTREPRSLGGIMLRDYLAAGPQRAAATFRLLLADAIERKLPLIEAPTLIVRGSRDSVVPQAWAEGAARLLPRGELRVVPGLPHTLNYSSPLELVRVVRPFLGL